MILQKNRQASEPEASTRRESSTFFMKNVSSLERERSLQKRNEQLAVEIGLLIAKNQVLQAVIRRMKREKFTAKVNASTQTTKNLNSPREDGESFRLGESAIQRSILQTYCTPSPSRVTSTVSRRSRNNLLYPSDTSVDINLANTFISTSSLKEDVLFENIRTSDGSARHSSHSRGFQAEDTDISQRPRRRVAETPTSYKEPSLRAKLRAGYRYFPSR